MRIRYRPPSSPAQYASAVIVVTRHGGAPSPAANQSLSAPTGAERVSMAALGIYFDGGAFCFAGYRYGRFADAMTDARRAGADRAGCQTTTWSLK